MITLEQVKIIKEKKTNICLAADVNDTYKLFELIQLVGEYICILKVHSDIIVDFYKNYDRALKHYQEWIDKGYDDVVIEKIEE